MKEHYNGKTYEFDFSDEILAEKEKKTLNKPFRTPSGPKKFSVYVKNEKGNVVKVNFGDPNMEIKRDDPNRRKNFRARHNCDNPGPKTKARYWSCRQWRGGKKVEASEWDGETFVEQEELLKINPLLASAEEVNEEEKEGSCCDNDCGCKDKEENSEAALTDKQKKLPPFIQKQIMKKKGKDTDNKDDNKDDKEEGKDKDDKKEKKESKSKEELEKEYASLWKNIHEKRERIKRGSGEKMRKKGEKGAPTPEQLKKAKSKSSKKKSPFNDSDYAGY